MCGGIMRARIFFMTVILCGAAVTSYAETIYLKDGNVVKGKVVNEGSYYIVVMEGNTPRRYYNDQILRIEKDEEPYKYELDGVHIDPSQFTDIPEEKVKLIITLMEVNGMRQNTENTIQDIIAKAPEAQRAEFRAFFDISEVIKQLIPIFDKYYTAEELKDIINFFRSASGRKMIETTPQIMKEIMQESVDYFKEKATPSNIPLK
jgi:hypothetical protein